MAETREQPASRARPMLERLAGAPISWGACEVPGWGRMPTAETVLAEMARLGLRGTELGPPGFLPSQSAALSALLRNHGLAFVGAFTPLVLHDADGEATARLARETIDLLSRAGGQVLVVAAVQDLAWSTPEPLDDAGWQRLAAGAAQIEALAAEHGITFALHPHVGTLIESADQVTRALAETEVGWCLDTGHLLIGGTDPAAFAREHGDRVTHVHLKDVDDGVASELRAGRLTLLQATQRGLFVALGHGGAAVGTVLRALHDHEYEGWLVLEQDTAIPADEPAVDERSGARRHPEHRVHQLGSDGGEPSMRRLRRSLVVPALVAAAVLLLAACGGSSKSSSSGSSSGGSNASTTNAVNIAATGKPCSGLTFAVITHGDNGSFWSVVYKGAKNAATDYGCKLSEVYGSQQQGQAEPDDQAENAQITDAINQHVDGLVVSDHDASLMNPTLAKAAKAGIPVVLTNDGCDATDIAASGALTCVGQPEMLAGQSAGQRFKQLGATNVLCVIHQSGQNLLDRCNGIAQGLGVGSTCKSSSAPSKGPACTQLTLSTPNAASNPQQAVGQVTSYLQSHPGINAVMTLNNAIGTAVVSSHPQNVKIATFDTNAEVLNDIKSGSMSFVVDQQQYLQGYLPIVILYLYKKHEGNTVGGGTSVPTGPLLVDKTNVSKVQAAIAAGDD